jgi:hypothetical protein
LTSSSKAITDHAGITIPMTRMIRKILRLICLPLIDKQVTALSNLPIMNQIALTHDIPDKPRPNDQSY